MAQIRAAAAGAEREKASRKADLAPAAAEDVGRIRGAGRSVTLPDIAVLESSWTRSATWTSDWHISQLVQPSTQECHGLEVQLFVQKGRLCLQGHQPVGLRKRRLPAPPQPSARRRRVPHPGPCAGVAPLAPGPEAAAQRWRQRQPAGCGEGRQREAFPAAQQGREGAGGALCAPADPAHAPDAAGRHPQEGAAGDNYPTPVYRWSKAHGVPKMLLAVMLNTMQHEGCPADHLCYPSSSNMMLLPLLVLQGLLSAWSHACSLLLPSQPCIRGHAAAMPASWAAVYGMQQALARRRTVCPAAYCCSLSRM